MPGSNLVAHPVGPISLPDTFGMGEESRPSEAKAKGCRGPIDRHPVRGTGNRGGANVPDSHPTPGAINLAPTLALSSLRSSGRYGFIKNVSGREVGPTALASHPALADSSRGGAELAA